MADAAPIDSGKLSFPFKVVDTTKIKGTQEAWAEVASYLNQIDRRMRYLQRCPGGNQETAHADTKVRAAILWIGEAGVLKKK